MGNQISQIKAISPSELRSKLEVDESEEVMQAVANINRLLEHQSRSGNHPHIFPTRVLGSTAPIRAKVIQLFKQAGWKVEFRSGQRDGDYYEFQE